MQSQGLARMMAPVARRVRGMIARCLLDAVDASALRQVLQVKLLDGEMAAGVEYMEPYGYTSVPLTGDGVFLAVGGQRSHGLAMAMGGAAYRPTDLAPGEVCIYTDEGDRIIFRRGRRVKIIAAKGIEFDTPVGQFTEQLADYKGTLDEIRDIFNNHVHPENDRGGPTSKPTTRMA